MARHRRPQAGFVVKSFNDQVEGMKELCFLFFTSCLTNVALIDCQKRHKCMITVPLLVYFLNPMFPTAKMEKIQHNVLFFFCPLFVSKCYDGFKEAADDNNNTL